jgi:hypothetical protein
MGLDNDVVADKERFLVIPLTIAQTIRKTSDRQVTLVFPG